MMLAGFKYENKLIPKSLRQVAPSFIRHGERQTHDFYATEPYAIDILIKDACVQCDIQFKNILEHLCCFKKVFKSFSSIKYFLPICILGKPFNLKSL